MKKIVALVLTLIMVLSLTACGGSKGTNKVTFEGDLTPDLEMAELKDTKVSILLNADADSFASADEEDAPNAMHRVFEKWKKVYGTEVEVITVNWDDFTSYLATAAASDQMPDVVYGGPLWFPRWPANKLVQPLDDYLDLSDSMWDTEIMDQLTLDGKHYVAYAQRLERFYIAYNKTKFDQAGETTPLEHFNAGTWNWTQFVKTAKNMTDTAQDEYGFTGWGLNYNTCIYQPLVWNDDGKLVSDIRNNNTVRWLTEVSNLYRSGSARTNGAENWATTFPSGKDAMVSVSPEEYIRFRQRIDAVGGDELAIAPMPVFDPTGETESITTANVYGFSIASKSKNPEGAAEFIRLYYKTFNAIEDTYGTFGVMEEYLTKEEKDALLAVDEIPVVLSFSNGVGNMKTVLSSALEKLNDPNNTQSAQSIIDAAAPLLEAELNEFYNSIG